jgi:site-specific recombinase XerD
MPPILEFPRPPGIHIKHGRYYLIHQNKWHGLTRVEEGAIPFWRSYYRLTHADPEFMAGVFLAFLEEGLPEMIASGDLKQVTADKYESYVLMQLIPYCGHIHRSDINSSHVARYLSERKRAGAAMGANRERAAWSTVNNWAMSKGWITSNPCHGVRRNKERGALEYVEHEQLVTALDRAPAELYALMGVAYLLGLRQTDLMLAEDDQVTEVLGSDGRPKSILRVIESKTGKLNEHEITPTVRLLLNKAREHKAAIVARYLKAAERLEALSQKRRAAAARLKAEAVSSNRRIFVSNRGLAWSESGLQSALARFNAGFQFRQLRPKAETDKPGVLGHTGQMQKRYQRKRQLKAVK